MTTCANLDGSWGAPLTVQMTAITSPSDLSTCPYIYMTGPEYGDLRTLLTAQGAPTQLTPYDYEAGAAFWAYGFSSLLILYVTAHCIGLVIKAVRDF